MKKNYWASDATHLNLILKMQKRNPYDLTKFNLHEKKKDTVEMQPLVCNELLQKKLLKGTVQREHILTETQFTSILGFNGFINLQLY